MSNLSRYRDDVFVSLGLGTNTAIPKIRLGIKNGTIPYRIAVLKEGQRLDQIAENAYGDGRLWWIIAAASNIGWWLQAPPGTRIRIPESIEMIEEII